MFKKCKKQYFNAAMTPAPKKTVPVSVQLKQKGEKDDQEEILPEEIILKLPEIEK